MGRRAGAAPAAARAAAARAAQTGRRSRVRSPSRPPSRSPRSGLPPRHAVVPPATATTSARSGPSNTQGTVTTGPTRRSPTFLSCSRPGVEGPHHLIDRPPQGVEVAAPRHQPDHDGGQPPDELALAQPTVVTQQPGQTPSRPGVLDTDEQGAVTEPTDVADRHRAVHELMDMANGSIPASSSTPRRTAVAHRRRSRRVAVHAQGVGTLSDLPTIDRHRARRRPTSGPDRRPRSGRTRPPRPCLDPPSDRRRHRPDR